MRDLLNKLRALEVEATPAPWCGHVFYASDTEFLAELRNAFPALADYIDLLEAVAEAAAFREKDNHGYSCRCSVGAALARLDGWRAEQAASTQVDAEVDQ
jgi:hypothetical protein